MNKWIADIFGNILTLGHVLTLIGMFLVFTEGTVGIMELLLFFVVYVLIVGTLTVFISINEKLGEIRDTLKEANKSTD